MVEVLIGSGFAHLSLVLWRGWGGVELRRNESGALRGYPGTLPPPFHHHIYPPSPGTLAPASLISAKAKLTVVPSSVIVGWG